MKSYKTTTGEVYTLSAKNASEITTKVKEFLKKHGLTIVYDTFDPIVGGFNYTFGTGDEDGEEIPLMMTAEVEEEFNALRKEIDEKFHCDLYCDTEDFPEED